MTTRTEAAPRRDDADFLEFVWLWNEQAGTGGTPAVHRRIARWIMAREAAGDRRLLLMAFRGCGKSTLVALWCAWTLSRDPRTRILVLAADHALATKMVSSVRRILLRHPLCGHLAPDPTSWAADRFALLRPGMGRDPSMLAVGIGGNITGARADVVLCDDVEVAGNCDTAGKRAELRDRLAEAEFVLVPGGRMLFVGTPHAADSLYRPADDAEAWLRGYHRLRVPVLDAAGRPAWPERFGRDVVEALRARVGPLRFARQMMLEHADEAAARLDPALIVRYGEDTDYRESGGRPVLSLMGRRLVSGGGYWDPAYGRPGGGDASVLAATYADAEGRHYLHRLSYLTHEPDGQPDPATQQCAAVAAVARQLMLPVVRVETNGIGRFLPALLRREMARAGVPCAVVEHSNHRPKRERILGALDAALAARTLHAHESVFRTGFPAEMSAWRPDAAAGRDDALDAVAGCLLAEPVRLPGPPPARREASWRGAFAAA